MPQLPSLPAIPLRVGVPAIITSLAYFNARWSLFYDWRLISALVTASTATQRAERNGRLNLFYVLENHASSSKTTNHPFIVYNDQTWTFGETYQTALRYGTWLRETYDVKPGEIVAIDFINSSTFIFILLGIWSIGAVPAFINYNLSGQPLIHSVRTSSARLLLVEEEVFNAFPNQFANFSSSDFTDGKGPMNVVCLTPEVEAQILQTEPIRVEDGALSWATSRDPAILIYTSGTTGLPKPAIVSWRKCWRSGTFLLNWLNLRRTDRIFTCMPLYHSSATLLAFMPCLVSALTIVIGRRFSARNFWKEVRESNATVIQYVGETMRYLLAIPSQIDPVTGEDLDKKHNVRVAFGNGLRPDVWNRVKERFNIESVGEFYASTEGTYGTWNVSSNDFAAGAIGRNGLLSELVLGRLLTIVEINHETESPWRDPKTGFCRKVARGKPGEMLYALNAADIESSFQGYYRNREATDSKILHDVFKKGDAWFRTGDLVRWDKQGRFYFSDRIGDTFRWKSENVSTSEVAAILGGHPDICEANVYGVQLPHHDGRAGCAAIIFRPQNVIEVPSSSATVVEPSQSTLDSFSAHVISGLPKFAVPLFLRVTNHMPTTGNNKLQKQRLQTDGVDPSRTVGDRLYWLQNKQYVPFEQKDWESLSAGQVKL